VAELQEKNKELSKPVNPRYQTPKEALLVDKLK